jgi:hypothetical protein
MLRIVLMSVCLTAAAWASGPEAQPQPAGVEDAGLIPLVPPQAVAFIERRGHRAIAPAFGASNTGKMYADEAIRRFVDDTRVLLGKRFLRFSYDLFDEADVTSYYTRLDEMLRGLWNNPAVLFIIPSGPGSWEEHLGFICMVDSESQAKVQDAVDFFLHAGTDPTGKASCRQAFSYDCQGVRWTGIAKRDQDFTLAPEPKAEDLQGAKLFLTTWRHRVLYIATSLGVAEAMSQAMTGPDVPLTPDQQVVLTRGGMKDWAFRWYVNLDAIYTNYVWPDDSSGEARRILDMLGLAKIRGVGGTEGYIDNVYARKTYVYAPGEDRGILKLFQSGGSYDAALKMTPPDSALLLAGRLDRKAALRLAEGAAREALDEGRPAESQPSGEPTLKDRIIADMEKLTAAGNGDIAFFLTDFKMMGRGMPSGGFILGLSDPVGGRQAVENLMALGGYKKPPAGSQPASPPSSRPASQPESAPQDVPAAVYRDVEICKVQDEMYIAILDDRVILGLNENAVQAAIDAAKDRHGGLKEGSQAENLRKLLPKGPAFLLLDLPAVVQQVWPMLLQACQEDPEDSPFTSVPDTEKMVSMVGPEEAVFVPDADGLLLTSRGKVPLVTKMGISPFGIGGLFWFGIR